jgi:hypothetical protein
MSTSQELRSTDTRLQLNTATGQSSVQYGGWRKNLLQPTAERRGQQALPKASACAGAPTRQQARPLARLLRGAKLVASKLPLSLATWRSCGCLGAGGDRPVSANAR